MRYIIGLFAAIVLMFIIKFLNQYVLKYEVPDLLIGWLTCMAYYISIDILKPPVTN